MQAFSRFSRYFMEVARLGSLRRAAESLHVSASAIDRQILQAEDAYGAPLFERLPSGMRLTAAGELLLADLQRWQREHQRTQERFDELQGLRRGNVSLACMEALSSGALPGLLARLGQQQPGIRFDLAVLENRQVTEQVAQGVVDFGLVLDAEPSSRLHLELLASIPLGLVVPPGHPLAGLEQVRLGETLAYRHLVADDSLMIGERVRPLYARLESSGQLVMRCNHVQLLRSLILAGAGIGVLSQLDVSMDVAAGRLVFIPLQGQQPRPMTLSLCIAAQRQLSRAALWAVEQIRGGMKVASA